LVADRMQFDQLHRRELITLLGGATGFYCPGGYLARHPRRASDAAQSLAMFGVTRLGYLLQLLAMTGWTSLPWLWSLRQPTLVPMGRDDPLVPPVNGRILARLIPNARLQMIDDGHLFMLTRPIETAMAIEAFLCDQ